MAAQPYIPPNGQTYDNSKALHWVFTLNNPTPSSLKDLGPELYEYLVYGRETAPETGTQHLQGYVCFKNRKSRQQVNKFFKAHWEVKSKKSTPKQASDYCKKDGDYVEEGVLPAAQNEAGNQAVVSKWNDILTKAKAGKIDEIDPKVQVAHYRTLKQIESDYSVRAPDLTDVCGLWLYGPPGCGKSHYARSLSQDYYIKPANKWWDGFNQHRHRVVLLEDLDKSTDYLGHHLKLWADKWSFAAEKKGSTIQVRPHQVVVTSNYTIEEIWGGDPNLCEAIKRRFKCVRFEPRNSPFSPLNSLVQAGALAAVPEEPIVVAAPSGHVLRRQNAMVWAPGTFDDWEDAESIDLTQDDGVGVGRPSTSVFD